jgi:hypothetical protein
MEKYLSFFIAFPAMFEDIFKSFSHTDMSKKIQILTIAYLVVSFITAIVMLVTSFEMFHEKYLPAFMISQKFTLPVILSAMGLLFITFFEPQGYKNKTVGTIFLLFFILTLVLFTYYFAALPLTEISSLTKTIFSVQIIALAVEIVLLARQRFAKR